MSTEREKLEALRGRIDAEPDNLAGSKTATADLLSAFSLLEEALIKTAELETRVAALETAKEPAPR